MCASSCATPSGACGVNNCSVTNGGSGCQLQSSGAMRPPTDPPDGLLAVPLAKKCVLLLTPAEYLAGIRRGKRWRRRQTMLQRTPDHTSPTTPPDLTL